MTFWRTLDEHRDRYLELARMQAIRIDPMVNKYVEALNVDTSHRRDYEVQEKDSQNQKFGIDKNTRKEEYGEKFGDYNYKEHSEQAFANGEGTDRRFTVDKSSDLRATQTKETSDDLAYRYSDGARTGGYTDAGSGASTEHTTGGSTEMSENTGHSKAVDDDVVKAAAKAAPMSAVNIGKTTGDGENTVSGSHLGDLDWEFASSYEQRDNGHINNTDRNDNSTTTGKTSSEKGQESSSKNVHNEAIEDVMREASQTANDRERVTTDANMFNRGSDTGGIAATTNAEQGSGNSLDISVRDHTGANTTTDTLNRDMNDNTQTFGTTDLNRNEKRINKNVLTGRDSLTPQEGLSTAEDYYKNYKPAIYWLYEKLETCFMSVFDMPVDCWF